MVDDDDPIMGIHRRLVLAVAVLLASVATACRGTDGAGAPPPTTMPAVTTAPVATTQASTTTLASTTSTRAPLVAGTTEGTVRTADGRTRSYRMVVPATAARSAAPAPLVLALHGGGGSGRQFERSSGIDAVAAARGAVVVYPDGIAPSPDVDLLRTWNAGLCCGPAVAEAVDDVGFVRVLIDDLLARYALDPRRVHAVGHSNGAMMGYRLACELGDRIASVAVQAGNLGLPSCAPAGPVSLLHLHGDADENVPIGGGLGVGPSRVVYPPVRDGLVTLARADGCAPEPVTAPDPAAAATVTTWSGCRGGAEVRYVEVRGATHAWMDGSAAASGVDAAARTVEFVLAHPRS